jgi:hypothetical protein
MNLDGCGVFASLRGGRVLDELLERCGNVDGVSIFIGFLFNYYRRFSRWLSRPPSRYATFMTTVSSLSGFRYTVPIGFQLRVSPDQRFGLFSLACP